MRKIVMLLFCLILIHVFLGCEGSNISLSPFTAQSYTTDQRSKTIHVVYDDSGSMILDNGRYFDRWGQAKYAMEVFAAMLEEKDTMRVYYMSDFDTSHGGSVNASAGITISGAEHPGARVAKIHNTVTGAYNTPYDTVAKAYADLKNETADIKWLVVLTDGEFNRLNGRDVSNIDVDGFFSQYVTESNVKIILLAMGDDAAQIKADPGREIYFEQAKNNNEILGKITSICNRIFNRNKIRFTNEARREFSFDIPMMELLIFAQGADVKINGIKGGDNYSPSETVNVRYSEAAATNYVNDRNVIVSRNLTGIVASFRDISKGKYSLDIEGESTAEVYYKPVVNIDIRLLKGGRKITTPDIAEGRYKIQYGIVNEAGKFFESSLLGNVKYEASVQNGGQTIPVKSGDTIKLQQGELKINVLSHFLEINTAENTITRLIVPPLPFKDRFRSWVQKYRFIFWPLMFLLMAPLLFWLCWGTKKRFPKYMLKQPLINIETDSASGKRKYGSFKIDKKTKLLPFCPERGTIIAAADRNPLPPLKVKALGNGNMELLNISSFSQENSSDVVLYIGRIGSTARKEMSCAADIISIFNDRDTETMQTCILKK